MNDDIWKERLRSVLGDFDLLEKCKRDTLENFEQFYEFIAEPAFESLRLELRAYRLKASYGRLKKRRMLYFRVNFPRSRTENFYYILVLPKNAVEMRLKMIVRGRRTPQAAFEDREDAFLPGLSPREIMKMERETLILDVIARYQEFNYRARTTPD